MKRVIQVSCLIVFAQATPGMAAPAHKPEVAEGQTVVPFIYAGAAYEDNLFLVTGPNEAREVTGRSRMSDVITRKGVGLRMKLPISLQTLRLDAAVERVNYQEFDNLDHNEGHAELAWDWEIGRALDGTLSHSYRRDMSSFTEFQRAAADLREIQETRVSGGYDFLGAWRIQLGGGKRDVDYDRQDFLDREEDSVSTELQYATSVNTQVGLRAGYTDADLAPLPSADGPVNNDYEQRQYRLVMGWEGSAKSYLRASAGYTERERDAGGSEFTGATGRLTHQWEITPVSRLRTSIYRNVNARDYQIASSVVTTGMSLKPSWQVTPDTTLKSHVRYGRDEFQGPVVNPEGDVVTGDEREDDVLSAGAGVEYAALTDLLLSLGVAYRERDSNRQASDYDNTRVNAELTYAFK